MDTFMSFLALMLAFWLDGRMREWDPLMHVAAVMALVVGPWLVFAASRALGPWRGRLPELANSLQYYAFALGMHILLLKLLVASYNSLGWLFWPFATVVFVLHLAVLIASSFIFGWGWHMIGEPNEM